MPVIPKGRLRESRKVLALPYPRKCPGRQSSIRSCAFSLNAGFGLAGCAFIGRTNSTFTSYVFQEFIGSKLDQRLRKAVVKNECGEQPRNPRSRADSVLDTRLRCARHFGE